MNFCMWITGLPGSGKTAVARELERIADEGHVDLLILHLDELRQFLTPEPRYTDEERELVYRALVSLAEWLVREGRRNVLIDATGNRQAFRDLARERIHEFAEIYLNCPLKVCQEREAGRKTGLVETDLYQKARTHQLEGKMPGVTTPYEAPKRPELEIPTQQLSPRESAEQIMNYVHSRWLSTVG
ncbi:MAG: adenylyl-sulfate kinase [Deltaproteobacteria bacterium]|nr:adenylyl-sulfate kinase [Deltaproteobacteria bacterium]